VFASEAGLAGELEEQLRQHFPTSLTLSFTPNHRDVALFQITAYLTGDKASNAIGMAFGICRRPVSQPAAHRRAPREYRGPFHA
jgi:hypothetical protein